MILNQRLLFCFPKQPKWPSFHSFIPRDEEEGENDLFTVKKNTLTLREESMMPKK